MISGEWKRSTKGQTMLGFAYLVSLLTSSRQSKKFGRNCKVIIKRELFGIGTGRRKGEGVQFCKHLTKTPFILLSCILITLCKTRKEPLHPPHSSSSCYLIAYFPWQKAAGLSECRLKALFPLSHSAPTSFVAQFKTSFQRNNTL